MSLRLKMIYGALVGAWGGFVAWLVLDVILKIRLEDANYDAALNGAVVGILVGMSMGGYVGILEGSRPRLLRGLLNGILVGLVGGVGGLVVGEILYQAYNQSLGMRIAGWAIFGVAIGASEGILIRSWRRIVFGVAGGMVGGVLGSMILVNVRASLGLAEFGRALGFSVLGGLIGLFVGLVPILASRFIATLKVRSSGRNEGKELLLDKHLVRIGRYDGCDLGLYGDKNIAMEHATIERAESVYWISAVGDNPVFVNDQPIQRHSLEPDDLIRIGSQEILFRST